MLKAVDTNYYISQSFRILTLSLQVVVGVVGLFCFVRGAVVGRYRLGTALDGQTDKSKRTEFVCPRSVRHLWLGSARRPD